MIARYRAALLTTALVALTAPSVLAAGLTLAWDRNVEPDIAGYVVKYGEQPHDYHATVDVGLATTVTVNGLVSGRRYYFTVLAYAADGSASVLAAELPATPGGAARALAGTAQFTMARAADGRLASPVLQWSTPAGAEGYQLRVGTTPGGNDVVDRAVTTSAFTLPALPFDRTYYARILTQQAGGWSYAEVAFQVPQTGGIARLVAPLAGARQVTAAQSFRWTPVAQAQAYRFEIGTRDGLSDVVQSGETLGTGWRAASLPAATRLYARLSTKLEGLWYATSIEFVSAPTAVLVYPAAGAADVSAAETFVWTGVTDAQAYRLEVGTTPGASDLVASGDTTATSVAVTGLPAGQTLYARVSTRLTGGWQVDAVTFTTALAARLTRPAAGDGSDLGQGLAWTSILGAEAYTLQLGTTPGGADLLHSGEVQGQTLETPALPAGTPIYARLATKHGGQWRQQDTSFTLAGAALLAPAAGTPATGARLTWTPITNAEAYAVSLGTAPGGTDLGRSGDLQGTSYLAPPLPAGRTVYVSLWTKTDGLWNGTAATLTTQ
ncbi:MAG TPA: fibronectin type III domain-containing protein [Ramlibacter sp.]|nr:fibronectin type III domain-containing protein [Ramlibacter sp.]